MMMKLMKFLVVALVAGGVFAPVPSQAGEVDGKAIMCEVEKPLYGSPYSRKAKLGGAHLEAYRFVQGQVLQMGINPWIRPRGIEQIAQHDYRARDARIHWSNTSDFQYSLDRKTLQLNLNRSLYARCELIDPDKITAYFQPYIDYGNALDEKAREATKSSPPTTAPNYRKRDYRSAPTAYAQPPMTAL